MEENTFETLMNLIDQIRHSPGERILREIESIQCSFRLHGRNYNRLKNVLNKLEDNELLTPLWDVKNRDLNYEAQEVVATELHNFLASAFSLVDHVRRHRRLY